MIRLNKKITKKIILTLSFLSVWTPYMTVWGDSIQDEGAVGQNDGFEFLSGFVLPTDNGTGDGGFVFNHNGDNTDISIDEIFSTPDGDINTLTDGFGNEGTFQVNATTYRDNLSGQTTPTALAYDTANTAQRGNLIDLRADPLWDKTDQVIDDLTVISDEFADCSNSTTFTSTQNPFHVEDFQYCEKAYIPKVDECTLYHDYEVKPLIKITNGFGGFLSCGHGCLDVWIGKVGNNYWSGNCTIYEESISMDIENSAVTSAAITYAKWDDYMQIYINGSKKWSGPNANFPPETMGSCELGENWETIPNTDISSELKSNSSLDFKMRTSVTGNGEGYAKIRILFDPTKLITDNGWQDNPAGCTQDIIDVENAIADGSCVTPGEMTCTSSADGPCTIINGIEVCEYELADSPLSFIHDTCKVAEITTPYDCNFIKPELMECGEDINGEIRCPINDGTQGENGCTLLEADPNCVFINQTCVDGAEGDSGACYVNTAKFDCGYDSSIVDIDSQSTLTCAGPIRCIGSDCVSAQSELESSDFTKAAAALQIVQNMTQDNNCDEETTPLAEDCEIFAGEPMECKIALGGYKNCCQESEDMIADDIGPMTYVELTTTLWKMDAIVTSLGGKTIATLHNTAAWRLISSLPGMIWDAVVSGFTTVVDSIGGLFVQGFTITSSTSAATSGAISTLVATITQQVLQATASVILNIFGTAVTNFLFVGVTATGAQTAAVISGQVVAEITVSAIVSTVLAVISIIMLAYLVFVIVDLIINIIWACDEEEVELAAQIQGEMCHYLGSYCKYEMPTWMILIGIFFSPVELSIMLSMSGGFCLEIRRASCCYNSPLSRIIMEQVAFQPGLAMNWGTPELPVCSGLTIEKIRQVDWELVDISEWVEILQQNGELPTDSTVDTDYLIENLTGDGAWINDYVEGDTTDGSRPNARDRTDLRLDGVNLEDKKREVADDILNTF